MACAKIIGASRSVNGPGDSLTETAARLALLSVWCFDRFAMPTSVLPWDLAAILFVLAVVVPWRGATHVRALLARPRLGSAERISIYASTIAFQWLIVAVTAWRCWVHGWSTISLGLGPADARLTVPLGAAMALILALLQIASLRRMAQIPASRRRFIYELTRRLMPQNLTETLPFIALVCTVSLCEEFLYRGFVYSVFLRLADNWAGAAVLGSAALFGIAHLYQGRRGVASTFALGVAFALTRMWTGSLIPGVIAHFVVDIVGGLAAPRALRSSEAEEEMLQRAAPPDQRKGE